MTFRHYESSTAPFSTAAVEAVETRHSPEKIKDDHRKLCLYSHKRKGFVDDKRNKFQGYPMSSTTTSAHRNEGVRRRLLGNDSICGGEENSGTSLNFPHLSETILSLPETPEHSSTSVSTTNIIAGMLVSINLRTS